MEYIQQIDGKNAWDYAPNYPPPAGCKWEGIVFHTDENGVVGVASQTIEQAIRTVKWQGSAGNTSGGSYHLVVGRKTDGTYAAVRSVRADKVSGSISGNHQSTAWHPERYPELKQFLSPRAYADPNAGLFSICIAGRTSDIEARPPLGLYTALAQIVIDFEAGKLAPASFMGLNPSWGAFLCSHFQWQTNRSDPGTKVVPGVLAEYERLKHPTTPKPVPPPINWEAVAIERQKQIDSALATIKQRNAALTAIKATAVKEIG